jgi:hypothetical protein
LIIDKRFSIVLLVNLPLILLPFYDLANLNTWINFVSNFHNSQSTFYHSTWPGGFFTLSALLPLQLAYVASGFNFYVSSVVFKLVFFLFTFLTAIILYDIVKRGGNQKKADFVFLFTMLNPAILYVNYIWAQLDIIPIFLVLLSYYLLRYEILSTNVHIRTMVALLPLFIAVFFYLYPIILVPALIYYTAKARQKFLIGTYALMYGVFFLAVDTWAFRGALYNYFAAGSGVLFGNSYFSGLQFYIPLSTFEYLALVVFLSLVLPLMIKKLSFGESSCLVMIILLFLYTSPLPLPDEFIWVYPFTVLALFEVNVSTISLRKIILLNLFPYVGLIFISLYIGTGFQQGIFYFGYNIFHLNQMFVTTPSTFLEFSQSYNALLILSLLAAFGTILILRFRTQKKTYVNEIIIRPMSGSMKWKLIACYSTILLLLILAAVTYNGVNNSVSVGDTLNTPVGFFYPQTSNSIYVMPVLDQTYWITGNSVLFYASYYTTILTRTLQDSNFNLTGTFSIYPNPPSSIGLIIMNNLTAWIANEPYLTSNEGVVISPSSNNANLTNNLEGPRPSNQSTYSLNGNSSLIYQLNGSSLPNHYYLFFFRPISLASVQTIPFYMKSGNNVYEVVLYSNYAIIAHENATSGTWLVSYTIPYSFSSASWNYVMFSSNNSSLIMDFNGYNYSINSINTENSFKITIGVPPVSNSSNYALAGYVTSMISTFTPPSLANRYAILLSNYNDSQLYYVTSLRDMNYQITVNHTHSMISIDNHSLSTDTTNQFIGLGKLSPDYYSILWLMDNVSLQYSGTGNYLLPAFFAFVTPYFVAFSILSYIYLKRKSGPNLKGEPFQKRDEERNPPRSIHGFATKTRFG